MLRVAVEGLAAAWPGEPEPAADLVRSLGFLGWDVAGERVVAASYVVGCLVGAGVPVPGVVLGLPIPLAVVVGVGLGVAVALGGPRLPPLVAAARRTRALGAAPALLTHVTMRMRVAPAPERAAAFAAEAGEGPLADSLAGHVRRAGSGAGTGLDAFAGEWAPWFPELERACALVESAGAAPPDVRRRRLERAREVVLEAASDRMAEFAASIRGPATALYAFGVLVPLALASLLPALRAAGIPASLPLVALVYDGLLPLGLLAASAWLLGRRPVAFPPPAIGRSHPALPDRRWPAVVVGLLAGAGGWLLAGVAVEPWTQPIAAAGSGLGATLVWLYRPAKPVRDRVRELESGLTDALSLLGRRVERGRAVEGALPAVADSVPGPAGDLFDTAARRQRRLGVGVDRAFAEPLGRHPSRRAERAVALVGLAASEGRPAGEALSATGEHLADLARMEQEARRAVERVTSTLSNTAAVFGPLVGGATIALADAMGEAGPLGAGTDVGGLGLAVGAYVLVLAAILTALATGLSRGFDRSLVGYRVGLALVTATASFLTAYAGTGLLV